MDKELAVKIAEAVLFVSDGPVSTDNILSVLEGMEQSELNTIIEELNEKLASHSLEVVPIAEGLQLRTRPEMADWIKKFHKLERSTRLSPASLEVLSIIAYRQPITRQEVEDIRGVDSSGIISKMFDRGLIKTMGRKKVPGRPMTFGTTKKFLEYFGLVKLSDMPMLKDLPEEGDEELLQKGLDFSGTGSPKSPDDLEIEDEAAMIEPANEDYEDEEEELDEFEKSFKDDEDGESGESEEDR